MTRHTLVKLGIGTLVAVVLAFWANTSRMPRDEMAHLGEPLLPGFREVINDATQMRIVEGGDKVVVSLQRGESGWGVQERGGYAADIAKVREYLIKLAEAKLIEPKTSNPERHSVLGVEDVAQAGAKGLRVELDGKSTAKFVVGTYSTQGQGTFVRRNDEAQAWLVQGNLLPERQVAQWLAKDLVDIASDRIMRVEINREGSRFAIAKTSPQQVNYVVEKLPPGRELLSEYEPNGIASVLAGLKLDDVAKAESVLPDPASTIQATFQTFDGLNIEVTGFTSQGKQFATLRAAVDPERADLGAKAAQLNAVADHKKAVEASSEDEAGGSSESASVPPADDPAPEAVADPEGFIAKRRKAVEDEAASLNARSQGWVYVLPAYKYANINKRLEDLLKPKG